MKYLLLVLPLLLTNCATTNLASPINGKVFSSTNGTTIIVGYLTAEEGLFPGNFETGPNEEYINYPEMARRAGIEGTVQVHVEIDENGNLLDAKVWRGIGGGCDETALNIIRNSTFTPAKDANLNAVSARHYIEVVFEL